MEIAKLVLEYVKALVWPGVALIALIRFRKPLELLLHRIASEAQEFEALGVKAKLRPSSIEEQAKKLEHETASAVAPTARDNEVGARHDQVNLKSEYLLAEELVLRNLEARWGQPIARNWLAELPNGRRIYFDGVVETPAQVTFVEVKLLKSARMPTQLVDQVVGQVVTLRQHVGKGVIGVLALVAVENTEEFRRVAAEAAARASGGPAPLIVEVFFLPQLIASFGEQPG